MSDHSPHCNDAPAPDAQPVARVHASWNEDEGFMLVKRLVKRLPVGAILYAGAAPVAQQAAESVVAHPLPTTPVVAHGLANVSHKADSSAALWQHPAPNAAAPLVPSPVSTAQIGAVHPQQQAADPMDWPLPCDVTVGHGTMRKGVALRTLVARMKALYETATGENADAVASRTPEERAARADAFQQQIAAAHPQQQAATVREPLSEAQDAARYRWLRSRMAYFILCDFPPGSDGMKPGLRGPEENWPACVDAAVDAAIAAKDTPK